MSINLTIAQWKTALNGLGKIVNKRASLPVLTTIHAHHEVGQLALQATDLDRALTYYPEQSGPDSPFLIPFEPLQRAVKDGDPNEMLRVSPDGAGAVAIESSVAGQALRQRHEAPPVNDWPALPAITATPSPVTENFKSALHQALECSSRDDSRHVLQGACLDATDSGDYIVGTDGRHLFAANSFQFPQRQSVIIPAHKFLTWKGFAEDGEWELGIQTGKEPSEITNIQLQSTHWTYVTRPIEGAYPNWRNVVPSGTGNTAITLAPESVVWLQATLPKLPVDNASTKSLLFATVDQELRIRAGSAGGVDMVVPGAKAKGDEVSVALNRDFVIKALKYGFTELSVNEPLAPVLFTAPGRQMIIMPVRGTASPASATPPGQAAPARTAASRREDNPAPSNRITTPTINERKITMSATTTPPLNGESKTGLQAAVEQVEQLRDQVREINGGLGEALRTLKDAAKQQRTSEREVNTIRNRLRSLQSVEI